VSVFFSGDTFSVFDVNGDGSLTPAEVQMTMKKLGFNKTLSQINQIVMKVDEDRNGVIDFLEFVSLMQMQRDENAELKKAFNVFDRNGDVSRRPTIFQFFFLFVCLFIHLLI
jgi:Ca2+-binding EF-hand superfamily protein